MHQQERTLEIHNYVSDQVHQSRLIRRQINSEMSINVRSWYQRRSKVIDKNPPFYSHMNRK